MTGCREITEHACWISVSDNAIQMAAVQWCKVFSSENNDIRHNRLMDESQFLKLLGDVPFKQSTNEMLHFRSEYVTHSGYFDILVPAFDHTLIDY